MMGHLERIREQELLTIRHLIPRGSRILEIGGGNGFQASLLYAWGYTVNSIDIITGSKAAQKYYPVTEYDGANIPFADASFDIVFSSNVLEHVRDLKNMFKEIRRVMRPDGIAVHILPTPSWRLWTILMHYPYHFVRLLRSIFVSGRVSSAVEQTSKDYAESSGTRNVRCLLSRILVSGPHGEYPSAVSELWYFSKMRWVGVFTDNGFKMVDDYPVRLLYTGYSFFPKLPMQLRKLSSFIFGSSGRVFVMWVIGSKVNVVTRQDNTRSAV